MKTEKFDIEGMTCSACVAHVEKSVAKLPGVMAVQVNLLTKSMAVRYEEENLIQEEIVKSVEKAGYKAIPHQKSIGNVKPQTGKIAEIEPVKADKETLEWQRKLISSLFFLVPLIYFSMGPMIHLPVPLFLKGDEHVLTALLLQFFLSMPVYLINKNFFTRGFRSLFQVAPNMDSLIAVGSSAAMLYGVFALFKVSEAYGAGDTELIHHLAHDVYFESGATILTLISLGKYLEAKSKNRTSEALSKLMNLSPRTALVIKEGVEKEVPVEELEVGDEVIVKSGFLIPVDGKISKGNGNLDESALTGESMPVFKKEGDSVMSGTLNMTGFFTFKATRVGENTTIAQIIHLVEQASSSKAPVSKLADKISGIFVPVVIVIALISTVSWLLAGYSFDFSLSIGIAVLVISCPCALGLATPVAIMVGTGESASAGILVKSAEVLETAHKIDTVVLDKTGTLTLGKPLVSKIFTNRFFSEVKLLQIAASIEKPSEHPLAAAILDEADFRSIEILPVEQFEVFPGQGVKAMMNERIYMAGNLKFVQENAIKTGIFEEKAALIASEGGTPLFIANATEVLGVIGMTDVLKPGSADAVKQIREMGIKVIMLTGDHMQAAEHIRRQAGIEQVIADVLPAEKESVIRKLQDEGKSVMMVGDGINDAPALMRAQVGMAIGAGSDIAIESADVVLIGNELSSAGTFIRLSRKVMKNIRQNLFWAFIYNILGIPLAAGVFYIAFGWQLSPVFAAAAMSFSSVTVVLNSLRIRSIKTP